MMKWLRYFTFLLFLFILSFFFSPISVNAQSVNGSYYLYMQQGTTQYMPSGYDPNFSESGSFPSQTYSLIPPIDTNNQIYYGIKQVYINVLNFNFTAGASYKLTFVIDKGSGLLGSSALLGYTNNRNLSFCSANGSTNDLSTCNISWIDNSDERWTGTILYTPTISSNTAYFQLGNMQVGGSVFLFNNYTGYQGFRISSFDVTQDSNDSSAIINNQNQNTQTIINNDNQNTQNIINSQNETTDAIEDLQDALTDDDLSQDFPSGGGGGTYFDSIGVGSEAPISNIILMPLKLIRALWFDMDTTCSTVTVPFDFFGGDYHLTFNCWTISDYLGDITSLIDGMFALFMIYEICMLGVSFFESITSLEDVFDSLYSPRHAFQGYKPKH